MNTPHLVRIYALAVCFVSVIVFSISFGVAVYDVIEANWPETTMSRWQHERFQSDDNFIRDWSVNRTLPDAAELARLREEGYRIALEGERRHARQSLVISGITMLIMVALFLIHWKLSRNEKTVQ